MKDNLHLAASFLLLLLLTMTSLAVVPPFTSITLSWERAPTHGTNITYALKWGNAPGATDFSMAVGTNLVATVTNLTSGYLYFSAFARTPEGVESLPSNTVIETNYPAAPLQLRITTNTTTSLTLEGTMDGLTWIHLATVTNDPALLEMRKRMMLRTTLPPLPR